MNGWKGRRWLGWLRILLLALAAGPVLAAPTVIDFEDRLDGDVVAAQYADLAFANATAITAGFSLNEFEFPPASGNNVVFEDGVGLSIDFATPMGSVYGRFNYRAPLIFEAFDASNGLLATIASLFGSNLGISGELGSITNEVIGATSIGGISRVVITGDPAGGSFTLDDLTFERAAPVNGVPEPSTLLLVVAGVVGLGRRRVVAAG